MTHMNEHTQAYMAQEYRNQLDQANSRIRELEIENAYLKKEQTHTEMQLDLFRNNI